MEPAEPPTVTLGRGRSGVVVVDRQDPTVARKVFGSSGLTKVVQVLLLGAPNPYAWNEHAVRCAWLRRRILARLVPLWTDGRLDVAAAHGARWNEAAGAFELAMERVVGRHVPLRHPLSGPVAEPLDDLVRRVLPRLQRRLVESGFDGLAWQAGLGNPVATGNFLERASGAGARWAWIDLESGVPALAPMSPGALVRFYLPRSLAFRRPLFDDVDTRRTARWLARHHAELAGRLGRDAFRSLLDDVAALAFHQARWKGRSRLATGVAHALRRGTIGREDARRYLRRPTRWYARVAAHGLASVARSAARAAAGLARRLAAFGLLRALGRLGRFLFSQRYRSRLARRLVRRRVAAWTARGQMTRDHALRLLDDVRDDASSAYLTDFAIHLAVKPLVKAVEIWLLPLLLASGAIGAGAFGVLLVAGGPAVRTAYTLGRVVQRTLRGRERPWVALGVGALPVVGNLAFPVQILYTGAAHHSRVAQLILYDAFATLGRAVPIWGARDSLVEHRMNRIPAVLVDRIRRHDASLAR